MGKFARLVVVNSKRKVKSLEAEDNFIPSCFNPKNEIVYMVHSGFLKGIPKELNESVISGSIGQLLIWMNRCFQRFDGSSSSASVLPKDDSLTIIKMAQNRSGNEAMKTTPTEEFLRQLGNGSLRDDNHSIFEFYSDFMAQSKMADCFDTQRQAKENLSETISSQWLSNLNVLLDVTTWHHLTKSEFGKTSLDIVLEGASELMILEGSSLLTKSADELATTMARMSGSGSSPSGSPCRTPSRRVPSSSPRTPMIRTPLQKVISHSPQVQSRRHSPFRSPLVSFSSPVSSTETHARHVLLAYLRLVLNSRDELALARCIDTPSRGLDHDAFTDLRHEAQSKGLPMFQCASSFVIRIRLGGRGYQPTTDCALNNHVKGLSELVDLIQKSQNILEEGDTDPPKNLQKVVHLLKNSICKSRDNRLRVSSIEKATTAIKELIQAKWKEVERLESFWREAKLSEGCEGKRKKIGLQGVKTKALLRAILDDEAGAVFDAPMPSAGGVLTDAFSSHATPVRFPSLWSQFESPLEDATDETWPTLNAARQSYLATQHATSPDLRAGKKFHDVTNKKFLSNLTWATSDSPPCVWGRIAVDLDDDVDICTQEKGPTLVMARPKAKKSVELGKEQALGEDWIPAPSVESELEQLQKAGVKRTRGEAEFEDVTLENRTKKVKTGKGKPKVRRKIIAQISGQKTLTSFFQK